jgi:dephospho-CoA kinase
MKADKDGENLEKILIDGREALRQKAEHEELRKRAQQIQDDAIKAEILAKIDALNVSMPGRQDPLFLFDVPEGFENDYETSGYARVSVDIETRNKLSKGKVSTLKRVASEFERCDLPMMFSSITINTDMDNPETEGYMDSYLHRNISRLLDALEKEAIHVARDKGADAILVPRDELTIIGYKPEGRSGNYALWLGLEQNLTYHAEGTATLYMRKEDGRG